MQRDAGACVDALERTKRGLQACTKERQAMRLGDHQVRRDEPHASSECLPEQSIDLGMVLVATTPKRHPRAAIDE
jgi:hypothetical protein